MSSPSSDKHTFITPDEVNKLPRRQTDVKSIYGDSPFQFGNLRLPDGPGPYPVVMVLHGGCWLSLYANLQNSEALADTLRNYNVATWNVEYRCVDQSGGGWPGTFFDVSRATDHLRFIACKYDLDLNNVIIIGHSAGGHLALWTAARPILSPQSPLWGENPLLLRGVIALAGPGDLKEFIPHADIECREGIVAELLGGTATQVPERYQDCSPIELLPLGIPQIIISSEHDWVVPPELGESYTKTAREAGDDVRHLIIPKAGHHELMAPYSIAWNTILQSVQFLLRSSKANFNKTSTP